MQIKISRMLETLLLALLVVPTGMLYSAEQNPLSQPDLSVANWADAHRATSLFNNMQNMARRVKREIDPIQVSEMQVLWQSQASKLSRVKSHVNKMGNDLLQLDAMKNKLEPWQTKLLHRLTPNVHELVYQTDAAIAELNAKQSATALALTQYPDNINIIASQTGHLIHSVGAFNQYQAAKAKVAKLELHILRANS